MDAEKRAFTAQQQVGSSALGVLVCLCPSLVSPVLLFQVQWMEEKLKASDSPSGDSEVQLFQRCQELQVSVQEKEEVIAQLAQQLEEQVSHQSSSLIPN